MKKMLCIVAVLISSFAIAQGDLVVSDKDGNRYEALFEKADSSFNVKYYPNLYFAINPNHRNGHLITLTTTAEYEVMFYDENNGARGDQRVAYGRVISSASAGVRVSACGPSGVDCMTGTYHPVAAGEVFSLSFRQPGATIRLKPAGAGTHTIVIWY